MFFHILYNTHYASVTLGLDHVRSIGYIQIAESIDKSLKPNQIKKGQRIYDYDNCFYMNILIDDFAKLHYFFEGLKNPNFKENVSIFTDQSKSSYNTQNLKTKNLSFVCSDKNGQRLIDQDGKPYIMIFANTINMEGGKKYIDYRCSYSDTIIIKNWVEYCSKILPGISGMMHQVTKLLFNKDLTDIKKESKYNQNIQSNTNNQQTGNAPVFGSNKNYPTNNNQQTGNAPVFGSNKNYPTNNNNFVFGNNEGESVTTFDDINKKIEEPDDMIF